MILKDLRHVPEFLFQKDVAYVDFLSRAGVEQGPQNETHPWLNLFVPKSRIADFNTGVFKNIVLKKNITTGLVLIYPMNHDKYVFLLATTFILGYRFRWLLLKVNKLWSLNLNSNQINALNG